MIEITPEELLCLGKLMNAEYIDYDYVKRAEDFQKEYALRESEVKAVLVKKGYLFEDFYGKTELGSEIEHILEPVFFGKKEAEIIVRFGLTEEKEVYKLHFWKDNVTVVLFRDKCLRIFLDGKKQIDQIKKRIIREEYNSENMTISMDNLRKQCIDRVLVLNKVLVGKKAVHRQLLEIGGVWFMGLTETKAQSLTKEAMDNLWENMMGED